jgi:Domain of Unknown Function (DUF1080)
MRNLRSGLKIAASLSLALLACLGLWIFVKPQLRAIHDNADDSLAGWQSIAGRWFLHGGVISNAHYGRGDMLIAPRSYGTDYHIAADVRFDFLFTETHYGDAGLVIRTTDPQPGVDSYRGYYVGLRPDRQMLVLGRASYDWRTLTETQLPGPITVGRWYHLELSARGCNLMAAATPVGASQSTRIQYRDDHCLTDGMAGLRSFYAQASWRNVKIGAP